MSPPISPRHRPPADKIPDGMSLLYADLPPKPEPPRQRARVELAIAGMLAAAGAAAAGSGIAGDLVRRFVRPESQSSLPAAAPGAAPFTGIERVVGAPVVEPPVLVPVQESEFAAPAPEEAALAELEPETPPPALPPTAAPPRDATMGSSRPAPTPPASDPAPTDDEPTETTTTVGPVPTTTAPTDPTTTTTTTTTTTVPPSPFDQFPGPGSPAYVLAVGAGYEVTPAAAATIAVHGFDGWVDRQLDPGSVPDETVDGVLTGFDLLDRPVAELEAEGLVSPALSEARWADFARAAFSERQIEAQLADLWRGWFALPGDDLAAQLELDQLVRTHALGRYADLAGAVASSAGLRRAHGVDAVTLDGVLDSSLAERVLVDWIHGPDVELNDAAVVAMAEAVVAGPQATAEHIAARMAEPSAIEHVGAAIGTLIGGDGSSAAAAAVRGFASGIVADAARAALLDGGVNHDRPATATTWLVRSLRRANATVTVGGQWDPADPSSVPGLLRILGSQPGERVRTDADERSPAAIAGRWEAARAIAEGGTGITVDLGAAVPTEPMAARLVVGHVAAVVDVELTEPERQAILDYLGVEEDTDVRLAREPFIDLCALALSFPTALLRTVA